MLYACLQMWIKFYTLNQVNGNGIRGITYIIIPTVAATKYFAMPIALGGMDIPCLIDNALLYVCFLFALFALWMCFSVLNNFRWGTSTPAAMKGVPKL